MNTKEIESLRDKWREACMRLIDTIEAQGYESMEVTSLCRQIDLYLMRMRNV